MAPRVLIGVVSHDRGVRDRLVDLPVDPREPGGDLVDSAVKIVDPRLQRDRELHEVLPAAADERALRVTQPARPDPRDARDHDRCDREHHRHVCVDPDGVPREMHPYDGSEKMTLYSAWLFATLTSPGTLATS